MCAVECNNNSQAFFYVSQQTLVGLTSSLSTTQECTQTNHTWYDSSVRVISPMQRPLTENTQRSQQTDIHARGGSRNWNPSKRAKADPCLTPRHWNRSSLFCIQYYFHTSPLT